MQKLKKYKKYIVWICRKGLVIGIIFLSFHYNDSFFFIVYTIDASNIY